jgi:hypothetical protein
MHLLDEKCGRISSIASTPSQLCKYALSVSADPPRTVSDGTSISIMQIRTSCERRSAEDSSLMGPLCQLCKYALSVSADPPRTRHWWDHYVNYANTHDLWAQIRRGLISNGTTMSIMQIRTSCECRSAEDSSLMGTLCQLCKYARSVSADPPRIHQYLVHHN